MAGVCHKQLEQTQKSRQFIAVGFSHFGVLLSSELDAQAVHSALVPRLTVVFLALPRRLPLAFVFVLKLVVTVVVVKALLVEVAVLVVVEALLVEVVFVVMLEVVVVFKVLVFEVMLLMVVLKVVLLVVMFEVLVVMLFEVLSVVTTLHVALAAVRALHASATVSATTSAFAASF